MGRRRQKKRDGFQDGLKVVGTYPLEVVLDNVGDHEMEIDGWRVRMNSLRYRTFLKDATQTGEGWQVSCVYCGLEATHFALQYNPSDENRKEHRAHFNLYAVDEANDGVWVLLTKDHVIPKSQGGKDHLNNMKTACRRCNARKADKMPEEMA